MKLVYLTDLYPAYVRQFYGDHGLLELEPYETQLARLQEHAFAWVGAWPEALRAFGYEVGEVLANAGPLQRTWAWENERRLLDPLDLRAIALEQVKRIAPDVLFADQYDEPLLRAIRESLPGLRLVIGWMGGTPWESSIWRHFDLVLSCAPESVEWLRARGVSADHIQHGFNHLVLPRLAARPKTAAAAFFGQIVTHGAFHRAREELFEALIDAGLPLEIHSPSHELGRSSEAMALGKMGLWAAAVALRKAGAGDRALERVPLLRIAARWPGRPSMPVSRKLKPYLRRAVYGVDMFQAVSESSVVLNVHADASISYASNMRLFEVTGAGTCLLTDWRENIPELFEPDREIATYRSLGECIEKTRWLLDHPAQCAAIGRAAQARTLRDHTYARRAERLGEIVSRHLRKAAA